MSEATIKFENVTKNFSLLSHKTFKEFLPALIKGEDTSKNFTALNKLSFEINKGETVGIIGPNGSGKSTILKLIAGVMSPTTGEITVNGKVSPLIELGAGFHFELSGRENIYLNGAILGLSQKQIDTNFKSIVDFANLWEYIDQPVKRYSSGMYMRLAFSIAVHVNPNILLVDEILAVGDPEFQKKCFKRMEEFKKSKDVTIVFVSHDMDQVKDFCSRVIYLNGHQIIADGDPNKICDAYLKKTL
jgi:ABC-type polysaccharide/polyol phosphate transport system ATPase subunit